MSHCEKAVPSQDLSGGVSVIFSGEECHASILSIFKSKERNRIRMSERKAVIKSADMSEDMQQDAVDCASQALEKYNIEKVCYVNETVATGN